MEKRFLLAFVLSLLVLVLSQMWFEKKLKPPVTKSAAPAAATNASPEKETGTPAPAASPALQAPPVPAPQQTIQSQNEHEVVLENALVKITLTNKGAGVKSWVLRKYKDSNRETLDLVKGIDPAKEPLPLYMSIPTDESLASQINSALFKVSEKDLEDQGRQAVFQYSENGVSVEKTLTLLPNSYLTNLTVQVKKNGADVSFLAAWPALFGDNVLNLHSDSRDVVTASESKLNRTAFLKVKNVEDFQGAYRFAGVEDTYFAAMFLSTNLIPRVQVKSTNAWVAIPPLPVQLYVGPKEIDTLKRVDPQLGPLIDFGWRGIAMIGKPMFFALKWIYGFCRNYGLAVILLTLIINMALFPLRWKSMVSAQRMQKIQPKIKAIQERYKKYKVNDPKRQEMNQEMMALYKEHGVNPLGGCLPLLLQMPILWAFYDVLRAAIELRQVSFLWIPDLSQYDKTYLLVIIMVVTQFIMQKMTPAPSADPTQAKMFMLMPLIFGFMFAKVASGLVLYWLTGNVVGIIQQFFLNKFGMTAGPPGKDKVAKGKLSTT